jgi:hypothetical protein
MAQSRKKPDLTLKQALAIVVLSLMALSATGYFAALPERSDDPRSAFIYYGPEGETVTARGATMQTFEAAKAALEKADYFGAVAFGPSGRVGLWTGALTPELAQEFALAACGADCTVVAQRLPLHRDPEQTGPVATRAMAENLAVKWPFTRDVLATGGAGAWGHRSVSAGKAGRKSAMRDAAAECEARRAMEAAPDPALSPPCRVTSLTEIVDQRPKPTLYPAAYTIGLTQIAPVTDTDTEIVEIPDTPTGGLFGAYLPPRLYGARAANGASSQEGVRAAGWPEAGRQIALAKCNASRRVGAPSCVHTHSRLPAINLPADTLAVTPNLFESFQAWEKTGGAGAFAISPYGVWGFSHDHTDVTEAIQKAADWCWYYTRKSWEYRQVDRAFLDPGVSCRIVAVRDQ